MLTQLLPIITLIIGLLAGLFADFFKHRWQWTREREARQQELGEARRQLQLRFQQDTLLNLQEAISSLNDCLTVEWLKSAKRFEVNGQWESLTKAMSENQNGRALAKDCAVLSSRVFHDGIREKARQFRISSALLITADTKDDSVSKQSKMAQDCIELIEQIGTQLRSIIQMANDQLPPPK